MTEQVIQDQSRQHADAEPDASLQGPSAEEDRSAISLSDRLPPASPEAEELHTARADTSLDGDSMQPASELPEPSRLQQQDATQPAEDTDVQTTQVPLLASLPPAGALLHKLK